MDCDETTTGEHYISHTILRSLELNGTCKIGGAHWIAAEEFRILPSKILTANVLCGRHNNALSPLDYAGGELIKTIGQFDDSSKVVPYQEEIRVFCGDDIERWMLKTVCSMQAAGQFSIDTVVLRRDIPNLWIDILFGFAPWPELAGLYTPSPTGNLWYHSRSFSIIPITAPNTVGLVGVKIEINGLPINLVLPDFDIRQSSDVQRPRTFIFNNGGIINKYIEFTWSDIRWDRYVSFTKLGTYDGPSPIWPEWARK